MSFFSEVESRRPPANVVVPVEAWATAWRDRPDEDVCIGLRFVPDAELEDARVEAYRRANTLYAERQELAKGIVPDAAELWIASFHDALVRWIVARGTCDPNDATKAFGLFSDGPEDIVRVALTDTGVQRIFDAWERMRIQSDISLPIASDEDLALLPALLPRLDALSTGSRSRALRLRRLLRFVLEELESLPVSEG